MNSNIRKDYFSFSKRERNAVAILIGIAVISICTAYFYSPVFTKPFVNQDLQQQLAALQNSNQQNSDTVLQDDNIAEDIKNTTTSSAKDLHPFRFNPNTIDAAGLNDLGLSGTIIQTIINYRNKGGNFNTADDFRKINGLTSEVADVLVPYINIPVTNPQIAEKEKIQPSFKEPEKTVTAIKKIDINTATAEDLKTLPGIGDVLGNRIVKFRNAVHGFKSVEDVRKTYGLTDSVYKAILPFLIMGNVETE